MEHVTWKVGGAQGEGIDSTGEVLASTLNRQGYCLFAYRSFMSLIKGGHTSYKVRVADCPVRYQGDTLDILIAFDQLSIKENEHELVDGAIVIHDAKFAPSFTVDKELQVIKVPMSETAKALGNVIMKNMVALGVSASVLGLTPAPFYEYIESRFGKKGSEVAELNKQAIKEGYDFCQEHYAGVAKPLPKAAGTPHYLISGNEAAGFGALLGGCRFEVAYPITPATEILYYAASHWPRYGAKVMQAEDEIAACIGAIAANYTGVRSMTSTSGPGLSLMMEALGLAGISETPLVIMDVQRAGPSTGMPTKPEQSDLTTAVYGGHGEHPRIVVAPSTVEECIYYGAEVFNLAERFQCPVLMLSDMFLGMSKVTIPESHMKFVGEFKVNRGKLVTQKDLDALGDRPFLRHEVTEDGISPRSIPGQKGGSYTLLSNESSEECREEVEDPYNRVQQLDKRARKMLALPVDEIGIEYHPAPDDADPDILLVGWGSTRAQLEEAHYRLVREGHKVGHLHVKILEPFPKQAVTQLMRRARRVLFVEQNSTGQLCQLTKRHVPYHEKIEMHLRYDGIILTVREIEQRCTEMLQQLLQGVR
ncbi:MAG TPA: 2-oxoacid:acceptor oxidoreductase subunit alpha [Symbiobacteriaceae bacterium]|nr:2-oxoacid:acceptor oxidoreductase subunit alpha [Symbiobacteriaceae bacterium]